MTAYSALRIDRALEAVRLELARATAAYPLPFHSGHEGYAVIREEVDELWDDVKASKGLRQSPQARLEAVQVAAMAVRFMLDLTDDQ